MDDNNLLSGQTFENGNSSKLATNGCDNTAPGSHTTAHDSLQLNPYEDIQQNVNYARDVQVKVERLVNATNTMLATTSFNGHRCRRKSKNINVCCSMCGDGSNELKKHTKSADDNNTKLTWPSSSELSGDIPEEQCDNKTEKILNGSNTSTVSRPMDDVKDKEFIIAKSAPIYNHETKESSVKNKGKSKRKRRSTLPSAICPICGITIRSGEMECHYNSEVKRLNQLYDDKSTPRRTQPNGRIAKKVQQQNKKGSSIEVKSDVVDEEEDYSTIHAEKRKETLTKVRTNQRKRFAKGLVAIIPSKRFLEEHSPVTENGVSHPKIISCPVCETPIEGADDELTLHVEQCLMKEETGVEVVESENDSYEEYTWAGQTRIRATTLLEEGSLPVFEGQAVKMKTTNEDEELDIDGDDHTVFGEMQYNERDVIPCTADEPHEDEARERIRAAITSDYPRDYSDRSDALSSKKWNTEDGELSQLVNISSAQTTDHIKSDKDSEETISSLRTQLIKLETRLAKESIKCLICMEAFNTPLVSVVCWHVYCEECWLRTLGTKKLCPQCNTITSPTDLRRIYI